MNVQDRASLAEEAIQRYAGISTSLNDEHVIDLMTDILHYAYLKGMNIESILRMARAHFITEKN